MFTAWLIMLASLVPASCSPSTGSHTDHELKSTQPDQSILISEQHVPVLTGRNEQLVSASFPVPEELLQVPVEASMVSTTCRCTSARWKTQNDDGHKLMILADLRNRSGDQVFTSKLYPPDVDSPVACRLTLLAQSVIPATLGEAVWNKGVSSTLR